MTGQTPVIVKRLIDTLIYLGCRSRHSRGKMIYRKNYRFFVLFLILISALLFLPARGEDEAVYYRPVTDIFLNVKDLSMRVGDQVTLPLTWLPAETPGVFLKWYADGKTVSIDP